MTGRVLPHGWKKARMGDIARVDTGGTPSRADSAYWGGGIAWMASGEVNLRRVFATGETISEAGLASSNAKVFEPGTLMLAMNGQGRTRGMVARLEIPAACNQSLAAIVAGTEANQDFLFHVLDSRYDELRGLTGNGRAGLNLGLIRRIELMLPPLTEQRAIAAILESIDEAIERTEEVIAATEALRQALLQNLLTHGVAGWHKEWKHVPGIGTIPADWEVVRLGELLSSADYGTNANLTDEPKGIPVLRMGNLQDGEIVWDGLRWADLSNEEQSVLGLEPGDILFNRTNSIDLVGKVAIVRDLPHKASFASYLIRLRTRQETAEPYWLNSYLNVPATRARLRRMATKGASQANINPTNLQSLLTPCPSPGEQRAIAKLMDQLHERIEEERTQLAALQIGKRAIADALLSGRVRVPTEMEVRE